jgi:hypothetical protein
VYECRVVRFSLASALNWAGFIYLWRRELQAVHEQAETLIALSTEQGLPVYLAMGTMWQGWARAHQGARLSHKNPT